MKTKDVWIVAVNEPVFYGRLYCRLISESSRAIKGIVVLPSISGKGFRRKIKDLCYRFRLWGTKGLIYSGWLLIKALFTGSGDLRKAAKKNKIPFYKCDNLSMAWDIIGSKKQDIVLSSVATKVPAEMLSSTSEGWVNTHCSLLPKYAGIDAPFWCLYRGEESLGVTLHYMDEDYDTGPIISQKEIKYHGQSYFQIVSELFDEAYNLHVNFLKDCKPVRNEATQQDRSKITFFGKPEPHLGIEFRKNGGRII